MNNRIDAQPGPLIEVQDLHKFYQMAEEKLEVLRGLNMTLEPGEMVSLVGKSGVGKSTLLHILGTLDTPSAGSVHFGGVDVSSLSGEELAAFRNQNIGFIFQFHHLLPEFTALENVMMPSLIRGESSETAEEKSSQLLERVGLSSRSHHRPAELSGGEQQRVAIARALVMKPRLILADEPTGNLDTETSEEIHELLSELNQETGISFLIATHNPNLAERMGRTLELTRGDLREKPRAKNNDKTQEEMP